MKIFTSFIVGVDYNSNHTLLIGTKSAEMIKVIHMKKRDTYVFPKDREKFLHIE